LPLADFATLAPPDGLEMPAIFDPARRGAG